jgi:hypothetical protein
MVGMGVTLQPSGLSHIYVSKHALLERDVSAMVGTNLPR